MKKLATMSMALSAMAMMSSYNEPVRRESKPYIIPGPSKAVRKKRKAVKKARRINRHK